MNDGAAPRNEWENYKDLSVGEILRRTRLHYNLSLNDIEAALRIRASQLEALEQGDIGKLPGRVYAIGFVRSYAEYLGLDGGRMVHLFKQQSVGSNARPELTFPVSASESRFPGIWIIGGSVAMLILIVTGWLLMGSGSGGEAEVPAVSEAIKAAAAPPAAPQIQGPPAQAAAAAGSKEMNPDAVKALVAASQVVIENPGNRISIRAIESSWLEIRDAEGKAIVSSVLKPGDTYFVPDQKGLTLATGNAGGIELKVDGIVQPSLGKIGDVRRNILLDPDRLKKSRQDNR